MWPSIISGAFLQKSGHNVLRDTFEFTGTKEGCGQGECDVCTVLVDGESVNSNKRE